MCPCRNCEHISLSCLHCVNQGIPWEIQTSSGETVCRVANIASTKSTKLNEMKRRTKAIYIKVLEESGELDWYRANKQKTYKQTKSENRCCLLYFTISNCYRIVHNTCKFQRDKLTHSMRVYFNPHPCLVVPTCIHASL